MRGDSIVGEGFDTMLPSLISSHLSAKLGHLVFCEPHCGVLYLSLLFQPLLVKTAVASAPCNDPG